MQSWTIGANQIEHGIPLKDTIRSEEPSVCQQIADNIPLTCSMQGPSCAEAFGNMHPLKAGRNG